MGVHTSEDKLGRHARDLVMAQMCSASQNTLILSAKTPLRENYATFLKPIFFWDTLYNFLDSTIVLVVRLVGIILTLQWTGDYVGTPDRYLFLC